MSAIGSQWFPRMECSAATTMVAALWLAACMPAPTPSAEPQAATEPVERCTEAATAQETELSAAAHGQLENGAFLATLHNERYRFTHCYQGAISQDSRAFGASTLRLVVAPDGKVASARVEKNQFPDCAAMSCIAQTFRELTFPAPRGGYAIVSAQFLP